MRCYAMLLALSAPFVLRAQDTTVVQRSVLAADRAAAGSGAALALALAPSATVLLPGLPVLAGAAAYRDHLPAIVAEGEAGAAWTPLHAVVARDGTLGCSTGVLRLVAVDSTRPATGRYAACWRRQRDGRWQLVALSRAPAPPAVRSLPDSLPGAPGSFGLAAPRGVPAAQAMADADRAFGRFSADSGGPANAFARWIAPDGMMLGARAVPVRGAEQVRQAFSGFPPTGQFAWAPLDPLSQASDDGSLGFTIGEARIAASPTEVSYSKYLTIWRREADGQYRWVFDIGSDRPASSPPR